MRLDVLGLDREPTKDGKRYACVRATPSWLARIFGAKPFAILLVAEGTRHGDGEIEWRFQATGRKLRDSIDGRMLLDALDRASGFDEVQLPVATLRVIAGGKV